MKVSIFLSLNEIFFFNGGNMQINIKQICHKKTVTRMDGEKIYTILTQAWNAEEVFFVNFDNILVASVSFMDEAFGKLATRYTKEELQKKLRFENLVEYDRALLNDVLLARLRQKFLEKNKKYITRVDSGRTHGWSVRVPIREKRATKFFSDRKYGGRDAALQEAVKHKEQILAGKERQGTSLEEKDGPIGAIVY